MVDFSKLNKRFANNFNNQKTLLKKLLQGKTVNCENCSKPFKVTLNEQKTEFLVCCTAGCTQLTLEIE